MRHSVIAAGGIATLLLLGIQGAAAQQPYDPMRALRGTPAAPAPGTPTAAPDPELGNLPAGPGAEETYYQCVACHSTAIIRQQRITDARWDYLWDWMIEEQGMPETDAATKATILDYLKTHFSSQREG